MLEPELDQTKPTVAQSEAMWDEISFTPVGYQEPAIDQVLQILRETRINGNAMMVCFDVSVHPVFDWFTSRNRLEEIDFFSHFLTHPSIIEQFPGLEVNAAQLANATFSWGSAFTLDGELAELMVGGGAYKEFEGSPAQAKKLGQQFCQAIFGERYLEIQIYQTNDAWSDWFFNIAWDSTYIILDKRYRRIWLLCTTDFD